MEQKAVNSNAQETVDTLDYIFHWLLNLWETLPDSLKAFALTVFAISILMEWVKRALLADLPKRVRVKRLWLASLPLGIALATAGAVIGETTIPFSYWAVIGLTAGTTAMGVHFVTVKKILPLSGFLWGRLMLAWRGS